MKEKIKMMRYEFDKKNDFVIYLQELIGRTYKCLDSYDVYLKRLDNYIKNIIQRNEGIYPEKIVLPYKEYSEFLHLLSGLDSYIDNLIGDDANGAISYKRFRDNINKRKIKGTLGFEIREIDHKTNLELGAWKESRNWSNHVPESLINVQTKNINEGKLKENIQNPLIIYYNHYCTLEFIQNIYEESINRYRGAKKVLLSMKKDYASIIGESVRIEREYSNKPRGIDYLESIRLSAEIQKV